MWGSLNAVDIPDLFAVLTPLAEVCISLGPTPINQKEVLVLIVIRKE